MFMNDLFGDMPKPNIPLMPEEYKGVVGVGCGYTISNPRQWTDKEIEWCMSLKSKGFSNEEIAASVGRTPVSIQIKLKRIGKKNDTYNEHHLSDKYACNLSFYEVVRPKTILDLYCGGKSFWRNLMKSGVVTNDLNADVDADYHERAEMLIHKLYYDGHKYDVIDLDPYGSAYDCFDLSIKMAQKGLIVTFGEFGHRRWKRLDFVKRYYGIESLEDFTLKNIVSHLEKIAERNKKRITPIISRTWDRIARVWFLLDEFKITEQWNK